jgi:hypothetical protein
VKTKKNVNMPIKDVKHGSKVYKTVTFGTGDVAVMTARASDAKHYTKVIFSQDIEKPSLEWDYSPIPDGTTSDDLHEETIFLEFDKLKSVDIVIGKLNEVREQLVEMGVTE